MESPTPFSILRDCSAGALCRAARPIIIAVRACKQSQWLPLRYL